MKRITLSIIVLLFLGVNSIASPVSPDVTRRAAANFWNSHRPVDVKAVDAAQLQLTSVSSLPMLHIWTVAEQGFVIMSASDAAIPVLAYSFNSAVTREPNPEVMFWLRQYNEQISVAENAGLHNADAQAQWQGLLNNPVPPMPVSLVVVPRLMTTTWDQGEPYNSLCPYDSVLHSRSVVGCVATAMAQIMRYWRHPSTGTGYHSYEHQGYGHDGDYGMLEANFGRTTYMWDLMPNFLSQYTANPRHVNAVATISYHCGVAVDMMYGPSSTGGSAAYSSCGYWAESCAESAFRDYFKYNPDLYYLQRNTVVWRDSMAYDSASASYVNVHYRADSAMISDSAWCALIDANLAQNAPMYYSGSDTSGGHAFVLDGSDENGRYHFNWGWGGYYDGYYSINNVAPGSGGIGGNSTYSFNSGQGAIFGILPLPEHFDSVTIYDTVCRNVSTYQFHEYEFPAADTVYTAVYLDTVFTINLHVISVRRLYVNPNGGTGTAFEKQFCPVEGVTLPDNRFSRNGYTFAGWGFARSHNDTIYQPGEHLMLRANKTIYAVWEDTTATVNPGDTVDPGDTVGIVLASNSPLFITPNPTHDDINISLTTGEDITVCIIDRWGRVVMRRKDFGGKANISLKSLPAGTYTVSVLTANEKYNGRIIKL